MDSYTCVYESRIHKEWRIGSSANIQTSWPGPREAFLVQNPTSTFFRWEFVKLHFQNFHIWIAQISWSHDKTKRCKPLQIVLEKHLNLLFFICECTNQIWLRRCTWNSVPGFMRHKPKWNYGVAMSLAYAWWSNLRLLHSCYPVNTFCNLFLLGNGTL